MACKQHIAEKYACKLRGNGDIEMEKDFRNTEEKLAIFVDFHNLTGGLRNEGFQIDLLSLRDYLAEGRKLLETFLFMGISPNNPQEDHDFHRALRAKGFMVCTKEAKQKPDGSLKCDLDIELTINVVEYILNVRPDIVILISGDGDFVPLVHWLRMRGIRVEVGGIKSSMAKDLRESANDYIDLQSAIEEIQEADLELSAEREEVNKNGNSHNKWQEGGDPINDNG
jgi:uncharacterized LabA/DUF88 family protein